MKKQLLLAVVVLGVQSTKPVGGAVFAVLTGNRKIMVDNINYIPQNPKTVEAGTIYDVKCSNDGRVMLENGDKDGVSIWCKGCKGNNGHCLVTHKKAGHYKHSQMVNGVKQFQHIHVVEKKSKRQKNNDK